MEHVRRTIIRCLSLFLWLRLWGKSICSLLISHLTTLLLMVAFNATCVRDVRTLKTNLTGSPTVSLGGFSTTSRQLLTQRDKRTLRIQLLLLRYPERHKSSGAAHNGNSRNHTDGRKISRQAGSIDKINMVPKGARPTLALVSLNSQQQLSRGWGYPLRLILYTQ